MELVIEIWGGIECTVNRVGDHYFDQLKKNGHDVRADDIREFAKLGIKKIRYPVLWKKCAPNYLTKKIWQCSDERMQFLRYLILDLFVGFLHQGSGHKNKNLQDPIGRAPDSTPVTF